MIIQSNTHIEKQKVHSFFFSAFFSLPLSLSFLIATECTMSEASTMTNTDIAERTALARREADQLKEKIKQKKESLADTTRKYIYTIETAEGGGRGFFGRTTK